PRPRARYAAWYGVCTLPAATPRCGWGCSVRFCGSSKTQSDVYDAALFVHFEGRSRLAEAVEKSLLADLLEKVVGVVRVEGFTFLHRPELPYRGLAEDVESFNGELAEHVLRARVGLDNQVDGLFLVVRIAVDMERSLRVPFAPQPLLHAVDSRGDVVEVSQVAGLEAAGFEQLLCRHGRFAFQTHFTQAVTVALVHGNDDHEPFHTLCLLGLNSWKRQANPPARFIDGAHAGIQHLPECGFTVDSSVGDTGEAVQQYSRGYHFISAKFHFRDLRRGSRRTEHDRELLSGIGDDLSRDLLHAAFAAEVFF